MKESINLDNLNADLVKAAKHGAYKLVELLLDAGADVNAEDDWALRWASMNGHYDVVKLLLDRGADPERVNLGLVDDEEIRKLILDYKNN